MKESHDEGLTNHIAPESCAGAGDGMGEALTGERTGWPLSPESDRYQSDADAVDLSGRQHGTDRHGEVCIDPTGSETPGMCGSISYGNREILCPLSRDSQGGRTVNHKRARQ